VKKHFKTPTKQEESLKKTPTKREETLKKHLKNT
jgi:hypothetical protein